MRKTVIIVSALFCACLVRAQESVVAGSVQEVPPVAVPASSVDGNYMSAADIRRDTLALPHLSYDGAIARYTYPAVFGGWGDWSLHPGLNASLSASATVGWGDRSWSGFAQSISLMYAAALTPRLSLAVGGYYSHFNVGSSQYNDAGLNAVLGYRFNEHWEAYIFARKSLLTPRMPMPLYDLSDIGDKIGAEVRYNFSPSFSVGLSVWTQDIPGRHWPMRPVSDEGCSAPR